VEERREAMVIEREGDAKRASALCPLPPRRFQLSGSLSGRPPVTRDSQRPWRPQTREAGVDPYFLLPPTQP
jgi:hypothetical protein